MPSPTRATRPPESERELKAILASTLDPIVTIDVTGTIRSASDSVRRVFGWEVDELVGRNVSVLMPEPHRSRHDGYLATFAASGRSRIIGVPREFRAARKDGTTFPCEICINAVDMEGRDDTLFAGIIRDISERVQREEGMRRLIRGLDASGEAFVMTDAEGVVQYVNPALERLCGRSSESLLHEPFELLDDLMPDDTPRAEAITALIDRGPWTGAHTLDREDGPALELQVTLSPHFDARGAFDGFVAVLNDLSQLKEAQATIEATARELEARNAELEQFVYTVSHDLKSPLVTIRAFAGHLVRDLEACNEQRVSEDVAAITRATDRMRDLIDDLLELSRIGRVVGDAQWTDLAESVRQSLLPHEGLVKNGTLIADIGDLPVLLVDPERMQQVLDNLVGNAVKYGSRDGVVHLHVSSRRRHDTIELCVRDGGEGIAPQYHDKIFNLFARLSTKAQGTGIGLAICKRIVEHLGGRIRVDSESGRGAAFCVELPAALADRAVEAPAA